MRSLWIGACVVAALSMPASAQSANERASALKQWRDQCSDADLELRTAYIEQAIADGDASISRICIRQALESDDADVRNIGLRAALASIGSLTFEVQISDELASAREKAGDDEKKKQELSRFYASRDWNALRSGLTFDVQAAKIGDKTSVWYPLVNLTKAHDQYLGKATVTGDRVAWAGSASLAQSACRLNARLEAGGELVGTFQCADIWPFPVRAKLL